MALPAMGSSELTDEQLRSLVSCLWHERDALSIAYASAALFLFDYSLTSYDEIRYIWEPRRISLTSIVYLLARYPALACTILVLIDPSQSVVAVNVATVLKLLAIIFSELVLALRTWAIWQKSRRILIILMIVSICAVIPAAVIIAKDMQTSTLGPPIAPQRDVLNQCRVVVSEAKRLYVIPYVAGMMYESVLFFMSLFKILRWRQSIPTSFRTPLIDALWKDGLLYFSWMIALGFINIGLVLQTTSPQLRITTAQLQMTLLSILSARIVLHLASLQDPSSTINLGQTGITTTGIQFTTRISTATDYSTDTASTFGV